MGYYGLTRILYLTAEGLSRKCLSVMAVPVSRKRTTEVKKTVSLMTLVSLSRVVREKTKVTNLEFKVTTLELMWPR